MRLENVRARLHNAPDSHARDPLSTARPAHILTLPLRASPLIHTTLHPLIPIAS